MQPALRDQLEHRELRDQWDLPGQLETVVHLELLERLVTLEQVEHLEQQGTLVQLEHLEQQERQETLGRLD